ncbi:MAG: hypothetical protein JWO03_2588 [Bacteroidetes bacterium]|nr:hypothetical protein [Bacteroidota bacterium]
MDTLSRPTHCPRCHIGFECKVGDIQSCECNSISLDDKERAYISLRFKDCLCAKCMAEMKKEYLSECEGQ